MKTKPDYRFLSKRCGISNLEEFKHATKKLLPTIDLKHKQKDFDHLLINQSRSEIILRFGEFIEALSERQ